MAPSQNKFLVALQPSAWIFLILSAICFVGFAKTDRDVYLVLLRGPPLLHYNGFLPNYPATAPPPGQRVDMTSPVARAYASYLIRSHDFLLERALESGSYKKLYSYHYLVNGFAISMSSHQANLIGSMPEVVRVEKDTGVRKLTTYTPTFLGLPNGAWEEEGGVDYAGEGLVIGLVDTGIDPTHPSFSDQTSKPYGVAPHYNGTCEIAEEFPQGSCNKKLVGARHFAAAAIEKGLFNASIDFASPLDGDGHGTHTASTAAGNNAVPVVVSGINFGLASGMAPRAHVAMYKALYRSFGGFFADVVAALEQAVQDGVDVLSLSIGPTSPPPGLSTFFNIFDMALLSAVRAGVFVAHAAGNAGPYLETALSFSPWICSVAAAVHDRTYPNSIILGNNITISGVGLAPGTEGTELHRLVLATDAKANDTDSLVALEECQDSTNFDKDKVKGRILICSYTANFLYGAATLRNIVDTVKNLAAQGVVILTIPEIDGHIYNPVPLPVPGIIIPTFNDSMILAHYCNKSSIAEGRISGGLKATFSNQAPMVASYSSRGPDAIDDQFNMADVLKPNILAPGSMIWAGWSPIGTDSDEFSSERFAMISGTSMATPHVAGIAALLLQKNPKLSPAAVASSLATTAFVMDKPGRPLLAQNPSADVSLPVGPATPFDFGGGAVNATAALDPGLTFEAGFGDYVQFLCSIPGSVDLVRNTTGVACGSASTGLPTDLNTPSITVANLTGTRSIPRTVTNIAAAMETYTVNHTDPRGVTLTIEPTKFSIGAGQSQKLTITLTPTATSSDASFGSIVFSGSRMHTARIPVAVISKIQSTREVI